LLPQSLARLASPRFLRFALVGFSGVFVNLGALFVLADVLHLDERLPVSLGLERPVLGVAADTAESWWRALGSYHALSSALAIEISIVWNFLLNNAWTFRDRNAGARAGFARRMLSYNAVSLVGLALQLVVFVGVSRALVQALTLAEPGLWKYPAQLAGIALAMGWNFFSNFHFTWAQSAPRRPSSRPRAPRRASLEALEPGAEAAGE
jgi:dolichol-phosphate mannosyltransferase